MAPPVRLIVCDFYLAAPRVGLDPTYSEFRGAFITQVPVLRLFGSTLTGTKACIHVHGVFPYLYVPYEGHDNPNQQQYLIANALDKALNVCLLQPNSPARHVFKIVSVSGIPFYGFHQKEHQFFKIYLFNPNLIKKTAELLLNGSVLGRVFQPYEAHLPYTQQFMIDYNLQGMHLVHFNNMLNRRDPLVNSDEPADREAFSVPTKVSTCEVEADVLSEDILNRLDTFSSQGVVNPGLAALWEDENQRRRDQGRTTQPTPMATQQRNPSGPSVSEEFHRCRLLEKLVDVGEDSICSTQTSSLSYPAEAPEGLMNASCVEFHTSRQNNATLTPDTSIDTQDEELLDLLDSMVDNQIEMQEEQQALHIEPREESDEENEMNETIEMTQPFIGEPPMQPNESSDDEDSLDDLFNTSNTFQNLNERLQQFDGADDKLHQKGRKKRLGTRGTLQTERTRASGSREGVSDGWLLKEINQVLEKPEEALEQLQLGIEDELLIIPEANIAIQMLEEEMQINENPAAELVAMETPEEPSASRQVFSSSSRNEEALAGNKTEERNRVFHATGSKKLGLSRGRKRVNVEVNIPSKLAVDQSSFEFNRADETLNISFEVQQRAEEKEKIKIRSCSVRLKRILLPKGVQTVQLPLAEAQAAKNIVKIDSPIDVQTQNDFKKDCSQQARTESEEEMEKLAVSDEECPQSPAVDVPVKLEPETWVETPKKGPLFLSLGEENPASPASSVGCESPSTPRSRKKRRNLSLSAPRSPLEKRESRKVRRNARAELKGMTLVEKQLYLATNDLKNEARHPPKEPDKFSDESDNSQDDSCLKSFYNLTMPPCDDVLIEPQNAPPSNLNLVDYGLQPLTFQPPFYSDPKDGEAPLSSAPCYLPAFKSTWHKSECLKLVESDKRLVLIEPLLPPPKAEQLLQIVNKETASEVAEVENLQQARAVVEENHLKVMHLEVLAVSRGKLKPDPEVDPVCGIFILLHGDRGPLNLMGMIAVKQHDCPTGSLLSPEYKEQCQFVEIVLDEVTALAKLVEFVQLHNPDIFLGYEIEMDSWGYVVQRAARVGMNLPNLLSRVPKSENHDARQAQSSQGAITEYSELRIPGRIVLNLWRLLKHEIAIQDYSLESVSFHLLHRRLPHYSTAQLLGWWEDDRRSFLVSNHLLSRLAACHQLLDSLDLLGRTSELARLFGIQFLEVFSRGSQFRVESMMLRLAKPKNFVPVSPSIAQKAVMKAPECIPLVMEPQSAFYEDPVAVLDFQSLYPSVIIAHNLCFSTCLGRVELLGKEEPFEFGCTHLKVDPRKIQKLEPFISPNGVAFVPKSVRLGILPAMLAEILETRLMVKQSLKHNKKDDILAKVLHARQLGLKLIANVTYGYTAANFSGRMPCIEVGDSVVAKGREILERAIRMVNENKDKWGGEVIYGDTDSMFVLFRGKTKQEAFEVAEKIAEIVTLDNPTPIKLKMEKVYQPCILQTKKRYVGFMYESNKQEKPVYEAKGIETVRRDGCPAVAKLLEKCLRILFSTKDLSQVKRHTVSFFQQVLMGTVSLQDFIFAKEFRGFSGYRPGACVPSLELARQWVRVDRRAEPRRGWRVPYVIVSGAPGLTLIRLVRCPTQLLEDATLRLNAEYYLTRALVPPLARCFTLLGVDVAAWLAAMPRRTVVGPSGRGSIAHFFNSVECPVCRSQTRKGLCAECQSQPQMAGLHLAELIRSKERSRQTMEAICSSCCGRQFDLDCDSLACPVMYRRRRDLLEDHLPKLRQCLQDLSF